MNRILLDTSAYSAFMRGNPAVVEAVQKADEIYLNPVVLGELHSGFMKGTHRLKNEIELSEFAGSPRVSFIDMDEETAKRYAAILHELRAKGTPIPTNDIWISSSAMQYGLSVLTLDKHFLQVPQVIAIYLG